MLMMSEHLCTVYLLHSFHHWAAAVFTSSSAFFSRENVALPGVALYFKVLEFLDHPTVFCHSFFVCFFFFPFLAAELFRFAMLVAKARSVAMAKLWPYKFAAMEKFLRVLKTRMRSHVQSQKGLSDRPFVYELLFWAELFGCHQILAQCEINDAWMVIDFLSKRGAVIKFGPVAAPPSDWVKNQDFSEVLIAFIKSLAIFKVKRVFQGAPISYFLSIIHGFFFTAQRVVLHHGSECRSCSKSITLQISLQKTLLFLISGFMSCVSMRNSIGTSKDIGIQPICRSMYVLISLIAWISTLWFCPLAGCSQEGGWRHWTCMQDERCASNPILEQMCLPVGKNFVAEPVKLWILEMYCLQIWNLFLHSGL